MVNEEFLAGSQCRNCQSDENIYSLSVKNLWDKSHNNTLDRLSTADCLTAYATRIQSTRRNLLLVTRDKNNDVNITAYFPNLSYINNTDLYWTQSFDADEGLGQRRGGDSLSWICSGLPDREGLPCQSRIGEITNDP